MLKPSAFVPSHPKSFIARTTAILAALGLVACSSSLDMAAIKTAISDGLKTQLGLEVASVTCPDSREIKAADAFECVAVPKLGGRLTMKVTQKDDQGNIAWELGKIEGLIDLAILEGVIRDGVKEQDGLDVTVACGGKFRATEPGKSFECTASDAEENKWRVEVLMKDPEGNVSYKVVQ